MTSPDFDRTMSDWLDARAPQRAPEHLLGATLHRTTRTRPRSGPAWRLRERWLPLAVRLAWGEPRRRDAVALALIILLAALLMATLVPLAGSRSDGPPKLGLDVPDGAATGTIETPLGPARWVHVVGDLDTLPPAWIESGEDAMFVADETRWDEQGAPTARRRWSSSDGMRWRSAPHVLPVDAGLARPFEGGGVSWLLTWQPSGLWRSADGDDWHAIDLTGVVPPGPAALTWDIDANALAGSRDVTLVHVILRPVEPFETLGWPEQTGRVSEIEPGVIGIAPRGEPESSPRRLRFEATTDGLRAFEDADGRLLAELPGVTYDDVLGWTRRLPTRDVIAIIEGERVEPVFQLSYLGDPVGSSLGTIRGTDDGFVALILQATQGPAHLWTSVNGRDWTDLGPWDLPVGGPGDAYYLGQVDGDFHAEFHPGATGMAERVWRSDDGVSWKEHMDDMPAISYPVELDSGMLSWEWLESGGKTWWGSVDGKVWESFDVAALGPGIADGDPDMGGTGDTAFIIVDDESGRRDMWILSFDTVPQTGPSAPAAGPG